nr:hypothetical protein [Clostridia bacterium]
MKDTIKLANHGNTKMVAHRGVSGLETENTAAAFLAAGNRSYWGVETDIYRTADGKYICNHDGKSGRICDIDLYMEKSALADLRVLTLNAKSNGRPRGDLRLCLPSEYRDICEYYGKVCVPELKSAFTLEEIKDILDIFDGYLENTVFISFNYHNLELVKQLRPQQKVQYLLGGKSVLDDEMIAKVKAAGMDLDVNHNALTPENIAACHAAGLVVNAWTVDNPERAAELIEWGVDQITSNILE